LKIQAIAFIQNRIHRKFWNRCPCCKISWSL